MRLRAYVTRRLILAVPVLFGVSMLTFTLSHIVGGPIGAVAAYVRNEQQLHNPAALDVLIKQHHLDRPLHEQYYYYLIELLHGDWGYSRTGRQPVLDAIRQYFPATFELSIFATIISLVVGVILGIVSAVRKDQPVDHATRLASLTGVSMPVFWLGLILQYVFYYSLRINRLPYLPSSGRVDIFVALDRPLQTITGLYLLDSLLTGNLPFFLSSLHHIILPSMALSYIYLAVIARIMRSSMLEVMRQDYITLARSKGLSERVVIYRHALRNAAIPTVTSTGLMFGALLAGATLTETVFAWPGLGKWATEAILTTDIATVMGFALIVAVIYLMVNLIVDLMYGFFDPRIRYG